MSDGTGGGDGQLIDVWVTRFAFTSGVFRAKARLCADTRAIEVLPPRGGRYHGNDWHRSSADAYRHLTNMIKNNRRSLNRQLASVDKLEEEIESDSFWENLGGGGSK